MHYHRKDLNTHEYTNMVEKVVCGFLAVNGYHCMNGDHCRVCNYVAPPNYKELEAAVKKTVEQYGETLRMLAKE